MAARTSAGAESTGGEEESSRPGTRGGKEPAVGGSSGWREQSYERALCELWPQEGAGFAHEADVAGSWPARES